MDEEKKRIDDLRWKEWGAYVSNREWGTVREDYSADGNAWNYISHDKARSQAYRWGEDGIAGWCDRYQFLVFSFGFWNGKDLILKERLFGLTPFEGNHAEDIKEYFFYLDATPTHSYMKFLYKYPHSAFPYDALVRENQKRTTQDPEYELTDTGVFEGGYFDIVIEYAKASPEDTVIRLTVTNKGTKSASLHVIPQLFFRNVWSWRKDVATPRICAKQNALYADPTGLPSPDWLAQKYELPPFYLAGETPTAFLFTENETGAKDAFHRHIIRGEKCTSFQGSKAAFHYADVTISPQESRVFRFRLSPQNKSLTDVDRVIAERQKEADDFYHSFQPIKLSEDDRLIQRQALAGMLWSTQFYHYDVKQWLQGDLIAPPPSRTRNEHWQHFHACDLLSMPDKWEYPWFASWDMAFHAMTLSLVDISFAKRQLALFLHNRYQHPSGQVPAYEWNFSDTNPPVQAWALLHLYELQPDINYLESCFLKLMENFSWWVNKVDRLGNNIFEGGFLGLDNISIIDRSKPLPGGGFFEQSDATGWMGFFALLMMRIALELGKERPIYQPIAFTYFEHFVSIASAMEGAKGRSIDLWDEQDGFFYDVISYPDGSHQQLKIRSCVGLIPFFSVACYSEETLRTEHPHFFEKITLYLQHNADLIGRSVSRTPTGYLFSLMTTDQMQRLLKRAFDPTEFLSPFGLRSLSKYHEQHPYTFGGSVVSYEPGESLERIKGGNSNWRGPIWMPINYLFLHALQRLEQDGVGDFSQYRKTLSEGLLSLFRKDAKGKRPIHQGNAGEDLLNDYPLFYEHYHGDTGRGLGASHQTGWSGLIAKIIQDL